MPPNSQLNQTMAWLWSHYYRFQQEVTMEMATRPLFYCKIQFRMSAPALMNRTCIWGSFFDRETWSSYANVFSKNSPALLAMHCRRSYTSCFTSVLISCLEMFLRHMLKRFILVSSSTAPQFPLDDPQIQIQISGVNWNLSSCHPHPIYISPSSLICLVSTLLRLALPDVLQKLLSYGPILQGICEVFPNWILMVFNFANFLLDLLEFPLKCCSSLPRIRVHIIVLK